MTTLEICLIVLVSVLVLALVGVLAIRGLTVASDRFDKVQDDLMRLTTMFAQQSLSISEEALEWQKYQHQNGSQNAPKSQPKIKVPEPDLVATGFVPDVFRDGESGPNG